MSDEARLVEKLRGIEALYAGATTPGERDAADRARERIVARLAEIQATDPPVEIKCSVPDIWSLQVFLALARRYGLKPYRYKRQHQSTVMLRVSERFARETLLPEFRQLATTLSEHLSQVTSRVVAEVLQADASEAQAVDGEPKAIGGSAAQDG